MGVRFGKRLFKVLTLVRKPTKFQNGFSSKRSSKQVLFTNEVLNRAKVQTGLIVLNEMPNNLELQAGYNLFELHWSQMSKIAFKSPTMVGENFEIYLLQMFKIAFKIVHHGWRKF